MGQYYTPILFTTTGGRAIASFSSYDYDDNGAKLMEHSYLRNNLVASVVAFMMSKDSPSTVVWLGDYAELEDDVLPLKDHYAFRSENNKCFSNRDYVKIFNKAKGVEERRSHIIYPNNESVKENLPLAGDVIFYNHMTRQKLSLREYRKNVIAHRALSGFDASKTGYSIYHFIVHPLPLLTSLGNGKGGGDYHGLNMEWVGAWALHAIEAIPEDALAANYFREKGNWEDISGIIFEENE